MNASRCHTVHFYETPESLLDLLEAFVRKGLARRERVVLLTLPGRWKLLADRLGTADRARIVFLDSRKVLSRILVDGRPDPDRFAALARELLKTMAGRPFRVFGDAVDLLAQEGNFEGAVRLEELWNDLRRSRAFPLF